MAEACKIGPVWHPATAKPVLLLSRADDEPGQDEMSLDLPVCRPHRDRAIEHVRESWGEIIAAALRHGGPRPTGERVGVRWEPIA